MDIKPKCRSLARRNMVMPRAFLAAILLILSVAAGTQSVPRESLLAIQRQVEAIEPRLVKSTVVIRTFDGSGSGVIVSPDGFILTAAHVVEGRVGRNVTAVLADGRTMSATVLAADSDSDLGIVKINSPADLPTSPLGDSSMLRRGEWILATGHPLGQHIGRPPVLRIGRVLTARRGRPGREPRSITTDAPIISGDSGGPLFDLNGRVVGINSMVTSGEGPNISIHIPINLGKTAIAQAEKGDKPDSFNGPPAALARAIYDSQSALLSGDTAAALRAAKEARDADPTSAEARLALARTYSRTGQKESAITSLEEAYDRGFNDPQILKQDPDFTRLAHEKKFEAVLARIQTLDGAPGQRKGDRALLDAASVPAAMHGVVRIQSGGTNVALGTIMSADGDILTKASELPEGSLTCILSDGQSVVAERRGVDQAWDIALLKVRASGLQALTLAETATVGEWAFSPDNTGEPAAIGIVGVAEMPVRDRGIAARQTSKAYMGVQLLPVPQETLKALNLTQGVRAALVQKDMPAASAGVQTGDIILEADGQDVKDPDGLMDLLLKKKPGDNIVLRLARMTERLTISVPLTKRPAEVLGRGGIPELLSGEVSKMQGPFTRVIQHDSVLTPNSMGGPLVDTDGKCLGINIARADRTSSYAIEARDMREIYARLKAAR